MTCQITARWWNVFINMYLYSPTAAFWVMKLEREDNAE